VACDIYNHCIKLHKRYYKRFHVYLDKLKLQKHITKLKKQKRFNYWNNLNSQAIQNITDRIHNGYTLFFNNLKIAKINKTKCLTRPPTHKNEYRYSSFTLKQSGYKLFGNNGIKINGYNFRFFKSRDMKGEIKTITVKKDALGDFYLFVVCDDSIEHHNRAKTGKTAGFDFGLKTFLTSSEGEKIESPQFLKQSLQKVRKAHRNLSLTQKGSNNRERAKLVLCRAYRKINEQRHDFNFKLAKLLTAQYDEVYFESLNLEAMKKLWGRKVSDLAFHEFLCILEGYCRKTGAVFLKIGRWEATSKTCHVCGYVKGDLELDDRSWTCPNCGRQHDRDENAAINIKTVGTSTVMGEEVRLAEIFRKRSSYHVSDKSETCVTVESHML
jgi:putative transposase